MQTSASLNVEDRKVLARSTDTKSNAADGVDERIGLRSIDLAADTSNINVDDVCRRIEMEIPDVLQQHRPWNYLALVADQILQNLEFSWQ